MTSLAESKWRVFLSSTSSDLTAYRAAAAHAISDLSHFALEQMEDWGANAEHPADLCDGKLRSCQVYVGILGHRYGSLVPPSLVPPGLARFGQEFSYTELEYENARRLGLPRLVYLLARGASDTSCDNEGPVAAVGLRRLRERIQGDYVTCEIASPAGLAARLREDLAQWAREDSVHADLVDRFREYRVIRRRVLDGRATVVCGPRGIGKSALIGALAGHLGRGLPDPLVAGKFGNRVITLDAPVPDAANWSGDLLNSAVQRLNGFAASPAALGHPGSALADPGAAVRALGDEAPTLFIVQSSQVQVPLGSPSERADALNRLAEAPAVLASAGTLVLETSDLDLASAIAARIGVSDNPLVVLDDLPADDAVALMVRAAPLVSRCVAEAHQLIEVLGGNPMALLLCAGSARRATTESARQTLRTLARSPEHSELKPYQEVMRQVIGQLPPAERELLASLAVLPAKPSTFDFEAVVALAVEHPTLAFDLAGRLGEDLEDVLADWADEAADAEEASRRADVAEQVRGLPEVLDHLCAWCLLDEVPTVAPEDPPAWAIHSLVAELALQDAGSEAAGQETASPARYERLETLLRSRVQGRVEGGYGALYRLEDRTWQDDVLTWLYVLPKVDAELARMALAGVYLDTLWWWGMYLEFPFSLRLLKLARRERLVVAAWRGQTRFLDLLEELERHYPKGYHQGRAEHVQSWKRVARLVRALITDLQLGAFPRAGEEGTAQEAGGEDSLKAHESRHILALLEVFLAESQRFAAPHAADAAARDGLQAEALAAYERAIALVDEDGDQWNAGFIRFELADTLVGFGAAADAESMLAEARRRAEELAGQGPDDIDFELLANVARVEADLAWARGQEAAAFESHGRAIHYAYGFMVHPWNYAPDAPAPDAYTRLFYREQRERCQARLDELLRSKGRAAAAAMGATVHSRFLGPGALRGGGSPAAADQAPAQVRLRVPTSPDDPDHPPDLADGEKFRVSALAVLRRSEQHDDVIRVPEPAPPPGSPAHLPRPRGAHDDAVAVPLPAERQRLHTRGAIEAANDAGRPG